MSVPRTTGVRSVELYCAEPLRPLACVAADGLEVRGFTVTIAAGQDARARLTGDRAGRVDVLRVLCLGERLDASTRTRLRAALDPARRGDLCLVHASSPRKIVEAVLEEVGERPRHRASRRTTRSFLANPTLIERQAEARPWARYVAAGALGLLAMAWTMRSSGEGQPTMVGSEVPARTGAAAPHSTSGDASTGEIVFTNTTRSRPEPRRIEPDRSEPAPELARPGATSAVVPGRAIEGLAPAPLETVPKRNSDPATARQVPRGVVPPAAVGWGTSAGR